MSILVKVGRATFMKSLNDTLTPLIVWDDDDTSLSLLLSLSIVNSIQVRIA